MSWIFFFHLCFLNLHTYWWWLFPHSMCTEDKSESVEQCCFIFVRKFDHIIINKNHKIKNKHMKIYKTITLLETSHMWFLIIILMYNKILNLNNYLKILYRNEWKKSSAKKQNNNENDQKKQLFKNLKEKYAHYFNTKKMTFLKLMIQMICYYICWIQKLFNHFSKMNK